jgi:hypothetical protein
VEMRARRWERKAELYQKSNYLTGIFKHWIHLSIVESLRVVFIGTDEKLYICEIYLLSVSPKV